MEIRILLEHLFVLIIVWEAALGHAARKGILTETQTVQTCQEGITPPGIPCAYTGNLQGSNRDRSTSVWWLKFQASYEREHFVKVEGLEVEAKCNLEKNIPFLYVTWRAPNVPPGSEITGYLLTVDMDGPRHNTVLFILDMRQAQVNQNLTFRYQVFWNNGFNSSARLWVNEYTARFVTLPYSFGFLREITATVVIKRGILDNVCGNPVIGISTSSNIRSFSKLQPTRLPIQSVATKREERPQLSTFHNSGLLHDMQQATSPKNVNQRRKTNPATLLFSATTGAKLKTLQLNVTHKPYDLPHEYKVPLIMSILIIILCVLLFGVGAILVRWRLRHNAFRRTFIRMYS